jgi:hypothetical protein
MKQSLNKIWTFLNEDWLNIIHEKYKQIPSVYIKSFIIIFTCINIAFAFHTINFLHGNDEWYYLTNPAKVTSSFFNGRFAAYYLPFFLVGNHLLPILTNLYGFLILTISAIAICIYWRVPKSVFVFSVLGILLVIQPYTLAWLFFSSWSIPQFGALLFVVLGYIISNKASQSQTNSKVFVSIIISSLLFCLALGAYQAVISTISIVFLARLTIDVFLDWDASLKSLKNIFLKHKFSILSVIIGAILYYAAFSYLRLSGRLIIDLYNLKTVSPEAFFTNFIYVANLSFALLWGYDAAFFPLVLIRLFGWVFVLGICVAILNIFLDKKFAIDKNQKLIKTFVVIFFIAIVIIFSKTSAIISSHKSLYDVPRLLFFGDTFLHIFPIALIFISQFKFLKNLTAIACVILINMCLIQDALALKVWKFAYEAEKNFANKVAMSIEQNPSFIPDKKYSLLIIGQYPSYRSFYYYKSKEYDLRKNRNETLIREEFMTRAPMFFNPDILVKDIHRINGKNSLQTLLKYKNEISDAALYPAKNSVIIKDDVIIVVLSQKELDEDKALIRDYKN